MGSFQSRPTSGASPGMDTGGLSSDLVALAPSWMRDTLQHASNTSPVRRAFANDGDVGASPRDGGVLTQAVTGYTGDDCDNGGKVYDREEREGTQLGNGCLSLASSASGVGPLSGLGPGAVSALHYMSLNQIAESDEMGMNRGNSREGAASSSPVHDSCYAEEDDTLSSSPSNSFNAGELAADTAEITLLGELWELDGRLNTLRDHVNRNKVGVAELYRRCSRQSSSVHIANLSIRWGHQHTLT